MSDKEKEEEKAPKPSNKKKTKFGDKECTVMQYAGMTGLNSRLKFWLQKKYDSKEMRTANEWCEALMNEKAISEKPEILDQTVTVSE